MLASTATGCDGSVTNTDISPMQRAPPVVTDWGAHTQPLSTNAKTQPRSTIESLCVWCAPFVKPTAVDERTPQPYRTCTRCTRPIRAAFTAGRADLRRVCPHGAEGLRAAAVGLVHDDRAAHRRRGHRGRRATWPARFIDERVLLERVLAPWLVGTIEHIGSTAAPGLVANPVVDDMAPVRRLDASRPAIEILRTAEPSRNEHERTWRACCRGKQVRGGRWPDRWLRRRRAGLERRGDESA